MRAAWYECKGPARDAPEAGPGGARVRLAASGVDPGDAKLCAGASDCGFVFSRAIPNSDGAGAVDGVDAGGDPARGGRRVWLDDGRRPDRAFGTAADHAGLGHGRPGGPGFAEAAALDSPAMTAHRCIFVAGKTALVAGGADAVGHHAVRLAKRGAARVPATVSGEAKAAPARAGGADAAVDCRQEDAVARAPELAGGEGADRIVEVDFGGSLAIATGAPKHSGAVSIHAGDGNPGPGIDARARMRPSAALHFVAPDSIAPETRRQAQRDVTRPVAGGEGPLPVAARLPPEEIGAAHEPVESRNKLGTIVVESRSCCEDRLWTCPPHWPT